MRSLSMFLILLSGCATSSGLGSATMAENNINDLTRICIGMTESQVFQIMRHPYSKKTIEYNGNSYDIWYYVTRPTALGQSRMVPQNLTPLTFENGILMGWGFDYYNYIVKKQQEPAPEPASVPSSENKGLEEDLELVNPPKQRKLLPSQQLKKTSKPISMCSRPNVTTVAEDEEPKEETTDQPYLDDEGEKMIEEEQDQNFNFW